MFKIKITTYEQDRLYFFVDQVGLAQKKYNRLFKTFKDAPYLSEGAQFLSDAGRELQFYKDVVEMLENGYRKQEWISVEDELPEECKNVLCFEGKKIVIAFMEKTEDCGEYVPVFWDWIAYDRDDTYDEVCVTHWMPLPEPPKMKGGK